MADEPTPARTTRSEPGRVFRSAIGWPASGQLLTFALVAASMTLLLMSRTVFTSFAVAVLIFSIAMATWLLAGTAYRIRDGMLTVSLAFRRRRIPLAEITSVQCWPHSSWMVGVFEDFSLASKRVMITYGESRVFVSPKNEEAFLDALGRPKDAS